MEECPACLVVWEALVQPPDLEATCVWCCRRIVRRLARAVSAIVYDAFVAIGNVTVSAWYVWGAWRETLIARGGAMGLSTRTHRMVVAPG